VPKPLAQSLPGKSASTVKSPTPVATKAANRQSVPPPPPPPPPPPTAASEPEPPMYKALFDFGGQEGEMSLIKEDLVQVVEKDDNGWWLVQKGGIEGWAPSNYLQLVPPKPKPVAPPPPPVAHRPPPAAPKSALQKPTVPSSLTANANAKPVSVFPGVTPGNGSATPWKKPAISAATSEPVSGRQSPAGVGRAPPPLGPKPKAPALAPKPGVGGASKPPVAAVKPMVPRKPNGAGTPPAPPAPPRPPATGGSGPKIGGAVGQMDLAAALAKRAQRSAQD